MSATLHRVPSNSEDEWVTGLSDGSDDEIVWSVSDLSSMDSSRAPGLSSDEEYIFLSRSASPDSLHEATGDAVAHTDTSSITSDLASAVSNLFIEEDSDLEGSIRPVTPTSSTSSSRSRRRRRRQQQATESTPSSPSVPPSPLRAATPAPAQPPRTVETPRATTPVQAVPPITAQVQTSDREKKATKKVRKAEKAIRKAERRIRELATPEGRERVGLEIAQRAVLAAERAARKAARLGTPKTKNTAEKKAQQAAELSTPQGRAKAVKARQVNAENSLRRAGKSVPTTAPTVQAPSPQQPTSVPTQSAANNSPADIEIQSQSLYNDAVQYISTFLAAPSQSVKKGNSDIKLLKAIIIELGLLPSITSTPSTTAFYSLPNLPTTLKKARTLIKDNIFMNVRDYLAVRERGLVALRQVMHPSRKALIKDLAKRKVPREAVKSAGLNVFLVAYHN